MPYHRQHNLLFVHIPKNAGRSIEQALFQDDEKPHSGRRRFFNRVARGVSVLTANKLVRDELIGTLDLVVTAQHLTYGEMDLLGLIPPGTPHSFAVVRNPYDRAVSSVKHFVGEGNTSLNTSREFEYELAKWLDADLPDHNFRAHRRPQFDYIINRYGERSVETLLKYENIAEEFVTFTQEIGISDLELPWFGRSSRARDYRDYFNSASRRHIEKAFFKDIDAFNYVF